MTDHDFLFKVVVIGDSGVGKSTLIEKYTKDSKDLTVEYKHRAIKVDDIVIKGQIWDVRNDKYKAYNGALGALLVYSVHSRASFKNCENWLSELKAFNAGIVVMLVGNKCDLNAREVPEDEAKTFALKNNLNFIETSAKDDISVGEAFERLLLEIFKQQTSTSQQQQQQQQQPSSSNQKNQSPHVPHYPPYSMPPVHDPLRVPPPHRPDFGIGSGDLYPSPGAGFGYIPGLDPFHGGNLIGPHHPGFGIRDPFAPNPAYFPGGGRGILPPRGARFDPFGPPGVRPYPDNDHLPPPGHFDDDMYM